MGKMHELLSVEGDKEGVWKKLLEETIITFTKKPEHFSASIRTYKPFDDKENADGFTERHEMTTTVKEKLDYFLGAVNDYFDVLFQKECTNQKATSTWEVDGTILSTLTPATFLLAMENRLKELRKVFEAIPTLQPGIKWEEDKNVSKDVFRMANPEQRFRTAKTFAHKILCAATDKHPAQIEKWEETVNVGIFETQKWSGMLSPAQKSEMLGRIDKLIQSAKQARMRANMQEVDTATVAKKITNFIMEGKVL